MKIIIVIKIYFIFLSKLIKSFSSSLSRLPLSLSCVELLLNARHYKSPFWFIAKSCVLKLLICVIYANQRNQENEAKEWKAWNATFPTPLFTETGPRLWTHIFHYMRRFARTRHTIITTFMLCFFPVLSLFLPHFVWYMAESFMFLAHEYELNQLSVVYKPFYFLQDH